MRNKKILCMSIFIFMIVLSIGAVSAQDADDAAASSADDVALEDANDATLKGSAPTTGSVSGGVDVVTENPGQNTSGELSYDIPVEAKTIKSADVYVNVYSGSASVDYGSNANITITTANGETKYTESLWINKGTTDGTVYTVNENITKCYSDYMIHYNITGLVSGLSGTNLKIDVKTFEMPGKQFDGRIKLVGLVLAYDDDDEDRIDYLIDDNQIWTDSNRDLIFDVSSFRGNIFNATLTNIALSSADATYRVNGEFRDPKKHVSGWYYQYNQWDISSYLNQGQNISLNVTPGTGWSGPSYKSVLSVIVSKSDSYSATVPDFKVADNKKNAVYPEFTNALNVTVNVNKAGKYVVSLFIGDDLVNSTEVDLVTGDNLVRIIDPTIRPLTDKAKYTGNASSTYDTVDYKVKVAFDDVVLNESSCVGNVWYNGYLGKVNYGQTSLESFYATTVTGDIKILTNGTYKGSTTKYPAVDFNVALSNNDALVKAFIYVTYTYGGINDNINMFNVTLNDNMLTPIFFARDASNLQANSGSGVIVYDATSYLVNGVNTLDLNKTGSAGVYPTTLVYMYNTTGSTIEKEVYIWNGADLLGTYGGYGIPIRVDSTIAVDSRDVTSATAYIFANGAVDGRGTVVINGVGEDHPWSGTSQSTDLYSADITSTVRDDNEISVIYSGTTDGSFTALQQIIVLTKNMPEATVTGFKVADNKKNAVYPEFANALNVTINTNRAGKYVVNLFIGADLVNSTEVDLVTGDNHVRIIDPTIRPLTDKAKYTGNASSTYDEVDYKVMVVLDGVVLDDGSCTGTVWYNGYLGKDNYGQTSLESFYTAKITGDIKILTNGTYKGSTTKYPAVDFNVALSNKDTLVKAFIYVTYTYGGINDNINMFNVTLNDNMLTPIFFARDASNLQANSGSGVIVYDATSYLVNGVNTLDLNKTGSAGVYPTTLVYMYNTAGSTVEKEVYIWNGADLLGTYGGYGIPIRVDSTIPVDASNVKAATAYIFANGAVDGRGSVVINGVSEDHPWNGSSQSTDLYTADITKTVKNSNKISVVYSGTTDGSFTALQQIIVLTKDAPVSTKITLPSTITTYYNTNKNVVITLKDSKGKAVQKAKVAIYLNGVKKGVLTTNSNGQVTYLLPGNLIPYKKYTLKAVYDGDKTHIKSSASKNIGVKKSSVKIIAKKKTFKLKTKVKKYTITLKDNKGKAMKKIKLFLKVKGKTYKAVTNAKGQATFKITKLAKKGKFKAQITFKGNNYFNKKVANVKLTVKK